MLDDIPSLTVRSQSKAGGETVLVVEGDIDLTTVDDLRGEIFPAIEHGPIVLDLAGVGFCDSSGLRVLIEASREAATRGTSFRVAGPTAPVERLLELTRAHEVLEIFPDAQAALDR